MSQMSSQSQDPSRICIPLGKYSYVTGHEVTGVGKLPWSHVVHNNLKVHIRDVRAIDDQGNYVTRVVMMVTVGAEVLEKQDLGEVLACLKRFNPLSSGESPVRIVIRPPTWFAMVYPSGNNVKRIQFKLLSQTDFETIVTIFQDLGFHTKDSPVVNPSVPPRTSTVSAPPPSVYSASSNTSIAGTFSSNPFARPTSAMRSSPLSHEISFGQTHASTFKLPPIPEFAKPEAHRQLSNMPFSSPYNPASSMVSRSGSAKTGQDMDKYSSRYLSEMDKEAILDRPNLPDLLILSSGTSRSDSSQVLPREHVNLHRDLEHEEVRHVTSSPFFNAILEPHGIQRLSSADPFARLRQEEDDIFTSPPTIKRPTSAPVDKSAMQDLLIPPKRILPFIPSKPRTSSLIDLPPLPTPTPVVRTQSVTKPPILPGMTVNKAADKPVKKAVAQRKSSVQPPTDLLPSTTHLLEDENIALKPSLAAAQGEVSPLAAKSAAKRPTSAAAVLQTKATSTRKRAATTQPASAAKRPKMVDQSTQTELRSDNTSQTPVNISSSGFLISPPEDYLRAVDTFITNHRARPPPAELYNTPEYKDASPEEREILVNNFICENLQNPNFIQLCKDASNSWRRIGLGM